MSSFAALHIGVIPLQQHAAQLAKTGLGIVVEKRLLQFG
jgi:hypothetical protein